MFVMNRHVLKIARGAFATAAVLVAACDSTSKVTSSGTPSYKLNPCSQSGTLTLAVATTALVDCTAGGTTLTLAGAGASYMIVPQFPTDQAQNQFVDYQMFYGTFTASASASLSRLNAARLKLRAAGLAGATVPQGRNMTAQRRAEHVLRARAEARSRTSVLSASISRQRSATLNAAVAPPAVGSIRTFHVASSFTVNTWATVGARLAYAGANVLVYIDTLAPGGGFTGAQLNAFGALFDQTLYPIDTAAFGPPTDLDNNGRVIMLMTPTVNADSPAATCNSQGFVAGFFDSGDFDGPTDPNSNQGEIFYSIVPDSAAKFSCAHSVADVGFDVPGTFMHEMQHLINYSQHVVVSGGGQSSSWLDEGMSIVAEELGSLYYEAKCPPPACRTSPAQLFPDSSQGFVQDFLQDSYAYALLPDTATITLSTDDEGGFSWRGGAWLFARYLGDQYGNGVFRQLERGPANALADVQQVTGKTFQALFANFGVALYTDSLPGLPRNTAPAVNRFVTRNLPQLWARLFVTGGGPSSSFPYADPVVLFKVPQADTTASIMLPGTMTFFRLDTKTTDATVTIRFSGPGGAALLSTLHPQLAIFRLPPNQ
jgi:hypothetical protein